MEAIELIEIIGRGEDSKHQLKENFTNPLSLSSEMAAFANSQGGLIVIGVSDAGATVGLTPEDIRRLNQMISNAASQMVHSPINPTTENVTIGGGTLIVLNVPEGAMKPYMDNNGTIWVKNGANKRRVTSREEIQRMLQSSSLAYGDEMIVDETSSNDVDLPSFEEYYRKQYNEELSQPPLTMLENLGLAKNGHLNIAGLFLFGKRPQARKPMLLVKSVCFIGNDPAANGYRDSEDIDGSLKSLYDRTLSFIERNLKKVQGEKSVNSIGELEIPRVVFEELIVNMLIHRDYLVNSPWKVLIFDNRIELTNPGNLPNNLTIENIRRGVSNMRNPIVSSFASRLLPYRGIGTGIQRALKAYPTIQFESDFELNQFKCVIERPKAI